MHVHARERAKDELFYSSPFFLQPLLPALLDLFFVHTHPLARLLAELPVSLAHEEERARLEAPGVSNDYEPGVGVLLLSGALSTIVPTAAADVPPPPGAPRRPPAPPGAPRRQPIYTVGTTTTSGARENIIQGVRARATVPPPTRLPFSPFLSFIRASARSATRLKMLLLPFVFAALLFSPLSLALAPSSSHRRPQQYILSLSPSLALSFLPLF